MLSKSESSAEKAGKSSSRQDAHSEPNLIVIKPPILVSELAAQMELKPFNIMADLIKIGVFPAPNQPLDPRVASRVCELHGFTLKLQKHP
jgi:translation initiation factor IF-2